MYCTFDCYLLQMHFTSYVHSICSVMLHALYEIRHMVVVYASSYHVYVIMYNYSMIEYTGALIGY